MNPAEEELMTAARAARRFAYAPYSHYDVGAAIRDVEGRLWTGANVENASYGLSICAERAAVAKMVSEGSRRIASVAVSTRDGGTPCGMCLQTLSEFAPDGESVTVIVTDDAGGVHRYSLRDLMPFAFRSDSLGRT
jgi:cytidine deaminase